MTTRDRILTTHVGSLPRPDDLLAVLHAKYAGEDYDAAELSRLVARSVVDVVRRQVELGLDLVNDGEMGKPTYATYVSERLSGFGATPRRGKALRDLVAFPDYTRRIVKIGAVAPTVTGADCVGPVAVADRGPLETDLENMAAAVKECSPVGSFMTSASPGVITSFQDNRYYPTHDAYLEALAEAMREEYEAIANAGFVLQLDSPDLAMNAHLVHPDDPDAFFRACDAHVEALNHATRNIAPERMRMHLCWGNYPGPHHLDVPLEKVLPTVLRARPAALLLEGANPRHEHEWEIFRATPLPDDKILVPGVLDTTSNYIEHPELVAQRLCRYADVVGRERVMAGTDCGFATFAEYPLIDPEIAWAKLRAMVEGAALASERLW